MNPKPTIYANSTIMNFSSMPPETLRTILADLDLTMSLSDLRFCQRYFSEHERRFPTVEEIHMLDAIIRIRRTHSDSYRLSRVNRTEGSLYETYVDLMQKFYADTPKPTMPTTLEDAAQVATHYLERIGIGHAPIPPSRTETDATLPPESAISLLLPLTRTVNFEEAQKQFLSDPVVNALLSDTIPIGEYGIVMTLAERTSGVFADLRRLVTENEPTPTLPSLVTALHNATLLVSSRDATNMLTAYATQYGLRAIYFAKATATNHWLLARENNPYLNMDIHFLRALKDGTEDADVYLPQEHPLFTHAINDALLATLTGAACGNRREEMALDASYTVPMKATSPEALGEACAAILGVYRVQMELCIPADAHVHHSSDAEEVSFSVSLGKAKHCLPAGAADAQNVYFLALPHASDSLPDFAAARTLLDTLSDPARDEKIGRISAVRAVTDSLATALEQMGADMVFEAIPTSDTFGLLLCASEPLPYPLVGRIAPRIAAESEKEETI